MVAARESPLAPTPSSASSPWCAGQRSSAVPAWSTRQGLGWRLGRCRGRELVGTTVGASLRWSLELPCLPSGRLEVVDLLSEQVRVYRPGEDGTRWPIPGGREGRPSSPPDHNRPAVANDDGRGGCRWHQASRPPPL